ARPRPRRGGRRGARAVGLRAPRGRRRRSTARGRRSGRGSRPPPGRAPAPPDACRARRSPGAIVPAVPCLFSARILLRWLLLLRGGGVEVPPPLEVVDDGAAEALAASLGDPLLEIGRDVDQLETDADRLPEAGEALAGDLHVVEAAAVAEDHPPLA